MKPALGSAELPTGEGLGELAQIIEIFIRDPTTHQSKRQERGQDQPPVSAWSGPVRIIHCRLRLPAKAEL
jgi:hypothetical protein